MTLEAEDTVQEQKAIRTLLEIYGRKFATKLSTSISSQTYLFDLDQRTSTHCLCTVSISPLLCGLDVLPCSRACAIPCDGQEVDVEAVIRNACASVSCKDLVVLRRAGDKDTITASRESATIQALQETEGCIDGGTTVSLGELKRSGVFVHVVALASRYQGVLDECYHQVHTSPRIIVIPCRLQEAGRSPFLVGRSYRLGSLGSRNKRRLP